MSRPFPSGSFCVLYGLFNSCSLWCTVFTYEEWFHDRSHDHIYQWFLSGHAASDYGTSLLSDRDKDRASEESPNDTLDAIYPVVRAAVIGEIHSITCDLTEAMAWLLPQRATAGEISPTQANTPVDGLLGEDSAPAAPAPAVSNVPIEIRRYIDRSRRL